jgi:hypothetical protein
METSLKTFTSGGAVLMIYQVKDWDENFENNKSRERDSCSFVCVPNKQHGLGFCRIMAEKDGSSIYGIWVMILGFCSQQEKPRQGWITENGERDGVPLEAVDLALKFRRPVEELERALSFLCSEKIGWICQSARQVPVKCPSNASEGKGRERLRPFRKKSHLTAIAETAKCVVGFHKEVSKTIHANAF